MKEHSLKDSRMKNHQIQIKRRLRVVVEALH